MFSRNMPADKGLAALVRRYELDSDQAARLDALARYTAGPRRAPTSARARGDLLNVHIADSLVGLEVDALRRGALVADIGSGAGFPGMPLAIALPGAAFTLIESQTGRCVYLELAIAEVGVSNATVVCDRAEQWVEGRAANDAVVARALAQPTVVLEYAAALLRVGGALIDWRGKRAPSEEARARRAGKELGMQQIEVRPVVPYEGATERHLHVYLKVRETPVRFPRRAGLARRRPLGASAEK
jgi:16S rRNA (guanine527-N7)-methyltransferase